MRVAVTGSRGRLGRALVERLTRMPGVEPLAWSRPAYDLDDLGGPYHLVGRERPDVVIHSAAWTDVDGCARDPDRAFRRNADATAELARVSARARVRLVLISTNEVFDGTRVGGDGYRTFDMPSPANPYGASKLAGERAAAESFDGSGDLAIVRTSWLFGPPGADFPSKILLAARRAQETGDPLQLVDDEIGVPTFTEDLAGAIVELIRNWEAGTYHVVDAGHASRAEWATLVFRVAELDLRTVRVSRTAWKRDSTPPAWGVLEPALPSGATMRSWQETTSEYVRRLAPQGMEVR
jgi:dTDP-4-dehydrorhamnose reductase